MLSGSFSIMRLFCTTTIARNVSVKNVFCPPSSHSVLSGGVPVYFTKCDILKNSCEQARNLHLFNKLSNAILCGGGKNATVLSYRKKYTKRPEYDSDSDSDDEVDNDGISKIISVTVGSMRTDLIVKKGLGIARHKVEEIFYEDRLRVNGKKVPKKSEQLKVEDEVDVIKGASPLNPKLLNVSRLVIVSAKPRDSDDNEEGIVVKLRKYKTLHVENYEDPWKTADK